MNEGEEMSNLYLISGATGSTGRKTVEFLLRDWRNRDRSALDRLTPIIYDDLHRLARARLKGERQECTLQPTALVHESYLRLADQTRLDVDSSRAHFYSIVANVGQNTTLR